MRLRNVRLLLYIYLFSSRGDLLHFFLFVDPSCENGKSLIIIIWIWRGFRVNTTWNYLVNGENNCRESTFSFNEIRSEYFATWLNMFSPLLIRLILCFAMASCSKVFNCIDTEICVQQTRKKKTKKRIDGRKVRVY